MINQNKNLYWNVYKNLEKEFLNLANYIRLTDNQLGVYSMRIANLIIRCAIEIESISKELYYMNGGNRELYNNEGKIRDLYFDTDCLNLLEKKWNISKKIIIVSDDGNGMSAKEINENFLTIARNRRLTEEIK